MFKEIRKLGKLFLSLNLVNQLLLNPVSTAFAQQLEGGTERNSL